jgi:hypothetical protein
LSGKNEIGRAYRLSRLRACRGGAFRNVVIPSPRFHRLVGPGVTGADGYFAKRPSVTC